VISVGHQSSATVVYMLGFTVELDSLLPDRPKQYTAGFWWQCFTSLGTVENNFGKTDTMEKEEYTHTQIKW